LFFLEREGERDRVLSEKKKTHHNNNEFSFPSQSGLREKERERASERGESLTLEASQRVLFFPFPLFSTSPPLSPKTMVLATEPGIWVPAVVLGHLIGICFLLYSLEKTNGSVSRLWKRMAIRGGGAGKGAGAGAGASSGGAAGGGSNAGPIKLMRGMSADNEPLHYERAPRWVRGCACKVKKSGS